MKKDVVLNEIMKELNWKERIVMNFFVSLKPLNE